MYDLQLARARSDQRGDVADVGIDDVVAQDVVPVSQRDLSRRPDRANCRLDLDVHRRGDLGAVADVHLVAVVLRRVVRRRHHHPDRRPQMLHGVGQHRRGQHSGQ
jgi:hypothetical protein